MAVDAENTPTGSPQAGEPANPEQSPSFEAGLAQLADIVNQLEGGGLGLSASIAAYERGVAMLGRLHAELASIEQRVQVLLGIDEEGRPVLQSGLQAPAAQPRPDGPADAAARPSDGPVPGPAASGEGAPSSASASKKAAGGRASSGRSAEGSAGKTPRSRSLPGMDGP